jgi:predicted Zn-ribbon and HTH transcriptional regulator
MDRDELSARVTRGATLAQIAAEAGVHHTTVRRWLIQHGLSTERMSLNEAARAARSEDSETLLRTCRHHGAIDHTRDVRGSYRCPRCNVERVVRRRRTVKSVLVERAGGRCAICGYDRCIRALSFHHVDPTTKQFGLALRGVTRSLDRALSEAAKCVLLCANCHMEVEAGVAHVPETAGPSSPH